MGKYDDIINLPHHVSDYHKPMPMENRAAQFAPFAALAGHETAIKEISRVTEKFKELSEEEKYLISCKLRYSIEKRLSVKITHFIPDKRKKGGAYFINEGYIKKWNESEEQIIMCNGASIPVNFISQIEF